MEISILYIKKPDRITRQKISKDIEDVNTVSQLDLINIYRTFYLMTAEYTFFSKAHGIFPRIDHMWAIKQVSIN